MQVQGKLSSLIFVFFHSREKPSTGAHRFLFFFSETMESLRF